MASYYLLELVLFRPTTSLSRKRIRCESKSPDSVFWKTLSSASNPSSLPHLSGLGFKGRHHVSRVHDTFSPVSQFLIVYRLVRRGDEHDIEAGDGFAVPLY